jgi:hypothetical protein
MITSWADEEDKANAKYDAIRGKTKQNAGGGSGNNANQGSCNNNNYYYSGPNRNRKRKPCEGELKEELWRF